PALVRPCREGGCFSSSISTYPGGKFRRFRKNFWWPAVRGAHCSQVAAEHSLAVARGLDRPLAGGLSGDHDLVHLGRVGRHSHVDATGLAGLEGARVIVGSAAAKPHVIHVMTGEGRQGAEQIEAGGAEHV